MFVFLCLLEKLIHRSESYVSLKCVTINAKLVVELFALCDRQVELFQDSIGHFATIDKTVIYW